MCSVHVCLLNLEPLRAAGPDVLDAEGVPSIRQITLHEIEVAADNAFNQTTIQRADDLFDCAASQQRNLIPSWGRLVRAVFSVQFSDNPCCRKVELRLPDTVALASESDAAPVRAWMRKHGFQP